jgi:hypothetical protein
MKELGETLGGAEKVLGRQEARTKHSGKNGKLLGD